MDIKEHLIECFRKAPSAPFLFVGSGFSRRYLGLPNWKLLLQQFATNEKFNFYSSTAAKDLPKIASLMAEDFHQIWWNDDKYAESRTLFGALANDNTYALRFEICKYIKSLTANPPELSDDLKREFNALKGLNVEGVITTNWDNLVETLYPEYKIYVGQDELLFANPQSIGEIYKIHGGVTRPESLILTGNDYAEFNKKNPYLASKLITLFVEHPIVFIGYSLADKNIRSLLKAIANVLAQDKLDKLSENLIFVQQAHGEEVGFSKGVISLDEGNLPITTITTNNFLPVYEALDAVKRKIPARILRYCKEQLYELVKTTEISKKILVVDANTIVNKEDIEFVIGVGVAAQRVSSRGYEAIKARDLFEDVVMSTNTLDAKSILLKTIPFLGKFSKSVPIYKYLHDVGVDSQKAYDASTYKVDIHFSSRMELYTSKQYAKAFARDIKELKANEIIAQFPANKAVFFLPFLTKKNFDLEEVQKFLKKYLENLAPNEIVATQYRKLICAYDFHKYGW